MTNFQKLKAELKEAEEKARNYEGWLKKIIIDKYKKDEIEEMFKEVGIWHKN